MQIIHVVGARPNFMKMAPVVRVMAACPGEFEQRLIHTGQHYDRNVSQVFFDELGLPKPDVNLNVGSGTHASQTAEVMIRFEKVLLEFRPDWVCVPGDVNSSLACALVAAKLGIRVAHIEAGLRSFDRTMPEEINRVLTDQLADLLFTPSPDADKNLLREGIAPESIRRVGNVMIDTLVRLLPKARERSPSLTANLGFDRFVLVTLHRPANVDNHQGLLALMECLRQIALIIPVVFPVHPRTRKQLADAGWQDGEARLKPIEPLGYLDFLGLQERAALVITDSGGVQEETTFLGVPCLTLRPNTERPITITEGTNQLVRGGSAGLLDAVRRALQQPATPRSTPPLWDGHAAERIVEAFRSVW